MAAPPAPEFLPGPPQPAAQTFSQRHRENSEGFSVKPFTFFNLGSASLSPRPQPRVPAPQQPSAPVALPFSPPQQQPHQQPQQQPKQQPQPQQFSVMPPQQFSRPLAVFPQLPVPVPTTPNMIPQRPVALPQQPQPRPEPVDMSGSSDNLGSDTGSFPPARDPAPRGRPPVTPGSVLFPNRS